MEIEQRAKEAADNWRNLVEKGKFSRDSLKDILVEMILSNYSMKELSDLTDIKRTTLYYIIWGKSGRAPVEHYDLKDARANDESL